MLLETFKKVSPPTKFTIPAELQKRGAIRESFRFLSGMIQGMDDDSGEFTKGLVSALAAIYVNIQKAGPVFENTASWEQSINESDVLLKNENPDEVIAQFPALAELVRTKRRENPDFVDGVVLAWVTALDVFIKAERKGFKLQDPTNDEIMYGNAIEDSEFDTDDEDEEEEEKFDTVNIQINEPAKIPSGASDLITLIKTAHKLLPSTVQDLRFTVVNDKLVAKGNVGSILRSDMILLIRTVFPQNEVVFTSEDDEIVFETEIA